MAMDVEAADWACIETELDADGWTILAGRS
jgi:hypothetical protein